MYIRNSKNIDRNIKNPVRKKYDFKNKSWFLVDSDNFIIAENLTKAYVGTMEKALNITGEAIVLLKFIIDKDDILEYKEGVLDRQMRERECLVMLAHEYLTKKVGLKEPPQNYRQNLIQWAKSLFAIPAEKINVKEIVVNMDDVDDEMSIKNKLSTYEEI